MMKWLDAWDVIRKFCMVWLRSDVVCFRVNLVLEELVGISALSGSSFCGSLVVLAALLMQSAD